MKTEKVTQLVLKLMKMTSNNELSWQSNTVHSTDLPSGEVILDKVYISVLERGRFRIYRYKYKYWVDEDRYEWTQKVRLELIDGSGNSEYEFEYDNSMSDLYDIVREQASNVSGILDEILGSTLEILEAKYYTINRSLDVTQIIKDKVQNNKLTLTASNEIAGDPEFGMVKKLFVRYVYGGEKSHKEVNEGELIKIP